MDRTKAIDMLTEVITDAARQWQMGYIKSLDWNTLTGGEA